MEELLQILDQYFKDARSRKAGVKLILATLKYEHPDNWDEIVFGIGDALTKIKRYQCGIDPSLAFYAELHNKIEHQVKKSRYNCKIKKSERAFA